MIAALRASSEVNPASTGFSSSKCRIYPHGTGMLALSVPTESVPAKMGMPAA